MNNNNENIGKTIVPSADNINTSSIFRNETPAGAVMEKMQKKPEYFELGLPEIFKSCPKDFLPVLAKRLEIVKFNYNANERELTMVADALVANLNARIAKEVKEEEEMTPEEALQQVRQFLSQQESDTSH